MGLRLGRRWVCCLLALPWLSQGAAALEIGNRFSVDTVITGVVQHGDYREGVTDEGQPIGDQTRGSVAADVNIDYRPTLRDTLSSLLSFARGNGLTGLGGVSLEVNADDLQDKLVNVSGWNWNNILEAWYRHEFRPGRDSKLAVSAGILDATNYLDTNVYANNEVEQFMNSAFVAEGFVPSHDPGAVLEFRQGYATVNAVWMVLLTAPKNEGGSTFNYYGLQAARHVDLPWGEGNYRFIFQTTEKSLESREGGTTRALNINLSLDQQMGDVWGVFVRAGRANADVVQFDHDFLLSGGLSIGGRAWGRAADEAGIAYAYLWGAGDQSGDVDYTQAVEAYARFGFGRYSNLSVDLQWVRDRLQQSSESPRVAVAGLRLNLTF